MSMERTKEEIVSSIEKILEENINPAVASHGGMIQFNDFDMESGIASVLLQGGCSGCASKASLRWALKIC